MASVTHTAVQTFCYSLVVQTFCYSLVATKCKRGFGIFFFQKINDENGKVFNVPGPVVQSIVSETSSRGQLVECFMTL